MQNTVIVIPAYEPDARLVSLVRQLKSFSVIVVNDGSGEGYDTIFREAQEAGAVVLRHDENRGKGAALKTAFSYLLNHKMRVHVVTADADGQHRAEDIQRVAEAVSWHESKLILGGRDFRSMPARSRFGNTVTSRLFRLLTGLPVIDTQTGLRGIPMDLLEKMVTVPGDRYEYELNALLSLREWGTGCVEIPISTIYLDNNRSSHFRSVRDGLRVFAQLLRFAASSFACGILDYALYCLLLSAFSPAWSYVIARLFSAGANYQLVRRMVFRRGPSKRSAVLYVLLAVFSMTAGAMGTSLLVAISINSVLAKLALDVILFAFNYYVQREWIFRMATA